MSPLVWLAVAVAAGTAAYLVGWPAVQRSRAREARDSNAERYLAWRGRARPPAAGSMREGMTRDERRRAIAGAVLAAVALVALVAFFVAG